MLPVDPYFWQNPTKCKRACMFKRARNQGEERILEGKITTQCTSWQAHGSKRNMSSNFLKSKKN